MASVETKFEKNFLLDRVPPSYEELQKDTINDGYVTGSNGVYERIREVERGSAKTWKRFVTEVLSGVKIESSEDISEGSFMDSWKSLATDKRLRKIRLWHDVPLMAFDIYQDELLGFGIAGSRHPTQIAADSFNPPDWINQGLEVTGLQQLQDPNLARLESGESLCGQLVLSAHGSTILVPELVLPASLVLTS
jgi:hypothetical protein